VCHGAEGQGVKGVVGAVIHPYSKSGPWPPFPRTVGNFWPYATTLFDFINRAMPANAPGSLQPDEVYSLVAWLLYKNRIIPYDTVMNATSLPLVRMPAAERFVPAPGVPVE
jgi:cytochrome c